MTSPGEPPEALRLAGLLEVEEADPASGEGLLDGSFEVTLEASGTTHRATLDLPPGAPGRPPSDGELAAKVLDCCGPRAATVTGLDWVRAASLLREALV